MTPVHCLVRHQPPDSYGDCVRACVASLLDLPAESVPHFAGIAKTGDEMLTYMRVWLMTQGYAPFIGHFDGDASVSEILQQQAMVNPGCYFMLFGRVEGGDHVVICRNDKIVHDPNWYRTAMTGPGSTGVWIVMVLTKL